MFGNNMSNTPSSNHQRPKQTIEKISQKTPMKAKGLQNKFVQKYRSMGSQVSRPNSRYESILGKYANFETLKGFKPQEDTKMNKKQLVDSLDDVIFEGEFVQKRDFRVNKPSLVDVVYTNHSRSKLPLLKGVEKMNIRNWNIKDICESNIKLMKELAEYKKKVFGFSFFKTPEVKYKEEIDRNHSKLKKSTPVNIRFEKCTPECIPNIKQFTPHYKEKPIVEDVELLRPRYFLPEFTDDMRREVENALKLATIREDPITLRSEDLKKMYFNMWLNDTCVDFYFCMIERLARSKGRSVRCFNAFFFVHLSQGRPNNRFLRKEDFFSHDLMLFPISLQNHWRLVSIEVKEKRITYYDSLGFELKGIFDLMFRFLSDRSSGEALNEEEWSFDIEEDVPRQENGYDCGLFILKYAQCLAMNIPFHFNQEYISKCRKIMSYELLKCQIISD